MTETRRTPKTIAAFCAICGLGYQAPGHIKAYENLCPQCYSSDTLREWDRIDSARKLMREGMPDSLSLSEWLHTVAAFHGRCSLCLQVPFNRLSLLVPNRGLTPENAIPVCKACEWHLRHDFARALARVASQMEPTETL